MSLPVLLGADSAAVLLGKSSFRFSGRAAGVFSWWATTDIRDRFRGGLAVTSHSGFLLSGDQSVSPWPSPGEFTGEVNMSSRLVFTAMVAGFLSRLKAAFPTGVDVDHRQSFQGCRKVRCGNSRKVFLIKLRSDVALRTPFGKCLAMGVLAFVAAITLAAGAASLGGDAVDGNELEACRKISFCSGQAVC